MSKRKKIGLGIGATAATAALGAGTTYLGYKFGPSVVKRAHSFMAKRREKAIERLTKRIQKLTEKNKKAAEAKAASKNPAG